MRLEMNNKIVIFNPFFPNNLIFSFSFLISKSAHMVAFVKLYTSRFRNLFQEGRIGYFVQKIPYSDRVKTLYIYIYIYIYIYMSSNINRK